jgi:hypothetical protein
MTEKPASTVRRLQPLFAAATVACPVSILTVALLQRDSVFSAALAMFCLGAALMVVACVLSEQP